MAQETATAPKTVIFPLAEDEGERTEEKKVLFVCTGNTCRSPMAEAAAKSQGHKGAFSRGIAAHEGDPISEGAKEALRAAGILPTKDNDYVSHTAKNATAKDLASADVIYCMTGAHAMRLILSFPQFAGKIFVMPKEIEDPFGGGAEEYKKALAEIISALAEIYPEA